MKKLRWQLLVVLLALASIAVLLLGQQPAILPGIAEAPIQPTTGGVYSEGLVGTYGRLNPLLDFYSPADQAVDALLYSGLIKFDGRGLPQGDLAESWGISQDGTVYNFSIRPNAVWHDGKPVTSEDVIFTVELLRDEAFPVPADQREFWDQVEVKLLDEKTLQFRLPEAFSPFMDYLTFGVLPKHLLDGMTSDEIIQAAFNLEPVGTGPYQFDHLIVEDGEIQGVVLNAFEDSYAQRPFIDQVIFRYYPDSVAALAAYEQGDVLGISQVSRDVLPQVLNMPGLNLYTGRLPGLTLVYLNLDDPELPFFQDAAIRRALLKGLNRQWMVNNLMDGQAIVADGPIFPGTWAYYENIEHLEYDRDAALAALKEAGYTIPAEGGSVRVNEDGARMEFELVYPDTGVFPQLAQAIQENWRPLGVAVTLKGVSYEELMSDYLEPRDYQAALVDLNLTDSPDPDPYPFWHQAQITGGQNYAQWDDRQASEYLEQARVETDLGEREKRYRNFQVRFTTEMPALPLYYPVYSYAVDESVQGVRMGPLFSPSDRFDTLRSWYLVAGRATDTPPAVATETPGQE
ncbi:MAG: peptide ABC transporter substrate-binding protein [Anaerolineales bacterium]